MTNSLSLVSAHTDTTFLPLPPSSNNGPPIKSSFSVRRREFYAYDHVKVITDASDAYFEEIGADMVLDMDTLVDTFIEQLQVIDSPDEICQFLDDEAKGFKEYQEGSSNLTDGLHAIVYVSHAFNRVLGEAVSLVRR
jgi:hypothetical protein